ncbi:MAG TPA: TonB family protein [Rhodanobacteraceae bacterium]
MSNKTIRTGVLAATGLLSFSGQLQGADEQVRVVPESELASWWQSDPASRNTSALYPVEAIKGGVEGCVAVAFEIHSDGTTSNERVWRSVWPHELANKQIKQSALWAVHSWRFIPAPQNVSRTPVYTYLVETFTLTEGTRSPEQTKIIAEFKSKCEMSDFPQQVQAMTNAAASAKGAQ